MQKKLPVNVFWFRRDLRLHDNAGLFHALQSGLPVLPVFIFDKYILEKLPDKNDARVTFICKALKELNNQLHRSQSSLLVKHNLPLPAWKEILQEFNVQTVFANEDYEPYARKRDNDILNLLAQKNIIFTTFKDQVIFAKNEVLKDSGTPYTVFTPYKRKWFEKFTPDIQSTVYPAEKYSGNFLRRPFSEVPSPEELGFISAGYTFPDKNYRDMLADYQHTRDIPGIEGTTRISVHLRFGTLSIRDCARDGFLIPDHIWLNELIWRDFYSMLLWHFPHTAQHSFKKEFDNIRWRNDENEFDAWCQGKTGYPMVDAGMRQLNTTGWMHNRVRMITASFLCKHLLIDWRWGEAYFARKLIDYDMASNIGGWQWAAGCGADAVPYFRIFNPDLQARRFDPELKYVKRWIAEFDDPLKYPRPVVPHAAARARALSEYKKALSRPF